MMKVLHSDVPLLAIEKEFPSGTASSLVGLIKGSRLRDRKKALAVLGRLKGIHVAVIARCLQMSRRTVRGYFSALQTAASMHCYRRRQPSQEMSQSMRSSCFRYFTRLHPATRLIEPPGEWMTFTELWLRVVIACRKSAYVPSSRRPDSNGGRPRLYSPATIPITRRKWMLSSKSFRT